VVARVRTPNLAYIICVQGGVMLPNMFVEGFGDQISRYATLIDPNNNEFQVLLKRFNDNVFFNKSIISSS